MRDRIGLEPYTTVQGRTVGGLYSFRAGGCGLVYRE